MKPETPRDLLKVDAKEPAEYGRFSLAHLTAYSVYWLSIWELPTTYENVSVLNARLFPGDFTMKGFPEMPDGMRTNRSLLQMRPKYRGLATSDPRSGVHLTEKGRREVAKLQDAIGPPSFDGGICPVAGRPDDSHRTGGGKERTYDPAQEIEDRKGRLLFRRFKEGRLEETEVVHLLGLLGLYDHTSPVEVRKEFKRLRDAAVSVNDVDFRSFLDLVQERFRKYLDRPASSHRKE